MSNNQSKKYQFNKRYRKIIKILSFIEFWLTKLQNLDKNNLLGPPLHSIDLKSLPHSLILQNSLKYMFIFNKKYILAE